MADPSPRSRGRTRRRLVSVAYEVFAEHGIRDAPVELICERAGFTRGAFYSNFASKEELFLAVYEEQMRLRLDRVHAAIERVLTGAPVRDQVALQRAVAEVVELFAAPFTADRTWYLVCLEFRTQALRLPELRPRTEATQQDFYRALGQLLLESLEKLGVTLTVSAHDAVMVLVSTYETALERAIFEGLDTPLDNRYLTDVLPLLMTALISRSRPEASDPAPR